MYCKAHLPAGRAAVSKNSSAGRYSLSAPKSERKLRPCPSSEGCSQSTENGRQCELPQVNDWKTLRTVHSIKLCLSDKKIGRSGKIIPRRRSFRDAGKIIAGISSADRQEHFEMGMSGLQNHEGSQASIDAINLHLSICPLVTQLAKALKAAR